MATKTEIKAALAKVRNAPKTKAGKLKNKTLAKAMSGLLHGLRKDSAVTVDAAVKAIKKA